MRISDWSSDVCSSDLLLELLSGIRPVTAGSFDLLGERFSPARQLDPSTLRRLRAAHVPEDRLRTGLVRTFAAEESAILAYHNAPPYNRRPSMRGEAIRRDCAARMQPSHVHPPAPARTTAPSPRGTPQQPV